MKTTVLLPLICVLSACVGTALAHSINEETDIGWSYDNNRQTRHRIVKRKGGKGGGGGRRGSSSGRKSASRQQPKTPDNYPYPKQPGSQSNPNPYPKQPPHNPNYPTGGQHAGYPANTGYNPGQTNYGSQGSHGMNMGSQGKTGGLGGILGGGSGVGGYKSRSGLGGMMGGAALGGVGGAVLGSVAGYQLGKAIGKMGHYGHGYGSYGYFDSGHYRRCEAPSRLEINPETQDYYIPHDIGYNSRCQYYDGQPSRYYGYYEGNRYHPCEAPKLQFDEITNSTYLRQDDQRCRYYERDPQRYRHYYANDGHSMCWSSFLLALLGLHTSKALYNILLTN